MLLIIDQQKILYEITLSCTLLATAAIVSIESRVLVLVQVHVLLVSSRAAGVGPVHDGLHSYLLEYWPWSSYPSNLQLRSYRTGICLN